MLRGVTILGLSRVTFACVITMTFLSAALLIYAAKTGAPLRYHDERQYLEIARHVADGQGFSLGGHPTAYRPPAWPLILAVFLMLNVPQSMLPLISAASMIAAAIIAARLGRRLAGSPWGTLAGIAMLIYPMNIYTSATLYPQAFATLLIVSLWSICLRIGESAGFQRTFLLASIGVVSSVLVLSVPTLAIVGVTAIGWVVVTTQRERLRASAYMASAFIAPIAAWSIRNAYTLGSPVVLSTSGGVNLLIGNNPTATASSGVDVDIALLRERGRTMSEVDSDRYLRGAAIDWITNNPGASFRLYLMKVLNYFSPYNEPVTVSHNIGLQQALAYGSFCLAIALVFLRLFLRALRPVHSTEWLFLGTYVASSFVMAIFFTRTRFRQPLDSILLIESAIACSLLVTVVLARRRQRLHDIRA